MRRTVEIALFLLFGVLVVIAAGLVVLARRPVHGVVALLLSSMGLACLFFMLEAHFLGVVQVLVSAGAILVLLLFVMSFRRPSQRPTKLSARKLIVAGLAMGLMVGLAALFLGLFDETQLEPREPWTGGGIEPVGEELLSTHLLSLECLALLLLVAMVGAAVIARRRS